MPTPLRAPFPYQGGKSKPAPTVWRRFGQCSVYTEPFCGSLAMLWAAPRVHQLEVANDLNCYIANFWRAVKHDADAVWSWADQPVVHIELAARHKWLAQADRVAALRDSLIDPDWPGDPKIAGWWVWGQGASIGSWCMHEEKSYHGQYLGGMPNIGSRGQGVHGRRFAGGRELRALQERLWKVRVTSVDWRQAVSFSVVQKDGGFHAIFLDPVYKAYTAKYLEADGSIAGQVEEWAREHGELPYARIALCGHVGDYDLPGWDVVRWSRPSTTLGAGIKGNKGTKDDEAIWFSPACLPPGGQLVLL